LNRFHTPYTVYPPAILDGFVSVKKVYILDFIQCGQVELGMCDFGCRRLIGSNFLDKHDVLDENKHGAWSFRLLEPIECTRDAMQRFLSEPQATYKLDGLMFYLKKVVGF
jgi:hypothetical protein